LLRVPKLNLDQVKQNHNNLTPVKKNAEKPEGRATPNYYIPESKQKKNEQEEQLNKFRE
jgi:hypothetical protein